MKGSIEVDDLVETPAGDVRVLEIDNARQTFMGQLLHNGLIVEWRMEEVEELAVPDPRDVEAVERWLKIAAIIVPALVVETDTVRCNTADCPCGHCYRIIKRLRVHGSPPRTEVTHHVDSQVCACDFDGGSAPFSACACMKSVTVRWLR